MQKARLIVTQVGESCRKDFAITCYGDHISLRFWSGSRRNKIVVLVFQGEIHVTTRETSLEWLREVFRL